MTRTEIILIVVIVGALVSVLLALRSGGPRVSQIDIRRDGNGDGGDSDA